MKKHKKPRCILSLDLLFQRHLMSYIDIAPFPPPKHFTVFTYRNVSHCCWNAAIWILLVPSSNRQQFGTENIYQYSALPRLIRIPIYKLPTCAIKETYEIKYSITVRSCNVTGTWSFSLHFNNHSLDQVYLKIL